jgi:hypothetical protein
MLNNHANRRYFLALLAVLFFGALPFVPAFHAHMRRPNAIAAPPPAPVRPVTDEYFGVKVVDPYRYMEDLKDHQVVAWFKAQDDYTHGSGEYSRPRSAFDPHQGARRGRYSPN